MKRLNAPAYAMGLLLLASLGSTIYLVLESWGHDGSGIDAGAPSIAHLISIVILAACLFLSLRRGQSSAEWRAFSLLVVCFGCLGLQILISLPYLDVRPKAQRPILLPLLLLNIAAFGSALASGALFCTCERTWVKFVGAWVILVTTATVVLVFPHRG